MIYDVWKETKETAKMMEEQGQRIIRRNWSELGADI